MMKLLLCLVLAACLLLLRAVFTYLSPNGDLYLLALMVSTAIGWERWRRRRGGDVIALGRQLAAIVASAPAPAPDDTSPPSETEPEATYLVFTYPLASRLRAYITALLCGFFGIGFLMSLIVSPSDDPVNGWLLFGLGIACLGGLVWSAWQLSWIGASLAVSPADLVHRSPGGRLTRLPWAALTRVTRQRFPMSLRFSGSGPVQIRVYAPIATDSAFLSALGAVVKVRTPGAS